MDVGNPMDGGWLNRIPPNSSPEVQIAAINGIIDRLNDLLKSQIYSDGTSRRLLIGFQAGGFDNGDSDFGIKMSMEGVDVLTATPEELLFTMSIQNWTWRSSTGELVKQFINETGTDSYYEDGRNYVNIGQRESTGSRGFEMAKPGQALDNEPQ